MSHDEAAAAGAVFLGDQDRTLLSRIEDAGLNASAPPQQRWVDGWIVRTCPGKAQRARCINAVAVGRVPIAQKLSQCAEDYRRLGLPMLVRVTPFTEPSSLDAELARRGFLLHDATRVMVMLDLASKDLAGGPAPKGARWRELDADTYAQTVGAMRGSSPEACLAHAQRLRSSPVRYRGFVLSGEGDRALACGQFAAEGDVVGLYDIATDAAQQRQGLGSWLCKRLLTIAITEAGARLGYLQVGADNTAARSIYRRMGFADAYSYHYRLMPERAQAGAAVPA